MRNPGPGTHSLNQNFSKNERPAYSLGKRIKQPASENPDNSGMFVIGQQSSHYRQGAWTKPLSHQSGV